MPGPALNVMLLRNRHVRIDNKKPSSPNITMPIQRHASLYHFIAPRYWPIWLGIGLMRGIVLLPYRWQSLIGTAFGRLACRLAHKRRHIASVNLRLCFPELGDAERQQLLRRHFEALGMLIIEMGISWWASPQRLKRLVRIEGLEHLQAALAQGHGVILLIAHFTTAEIGGQALGLYTPFHFMHRRNENPLIAAIMEHGRKKTDEEMIAHDDIRTMMRALKQGHAVWYAPDQNYRHKGSLMTPFFGIPAPTNSATARIARASGAPVVSYYTHRLEDGSGYRLTIQPALEHFHTNDIAADTRRINAVIEAQVREQPAEYLWVHQRFKGIDPEQDIYRRR